MKLYRAIWSHAGPCGAISSHMGPYGFMWPHIQFSSVVRLMHPSWGSCTAQLSTFYAMLCYIMLCYAVFYGIMLHDAMLCCIVRPSVWPRMASYGPTWRHMAPYGPIRLPVAPYGSTWLHTAPDGFRWAHMDPWLYPLPSTYMYT